MHQMVSTPVDSSRRWWVLTIVVAALVSFSFLTMVDRDRSYVANLAQHSLLAQRSARLSVD